MVLLPYPRVAQVLAGLAIAPPRADIEPSLRDYRKPATGFALLGKPAVAPGERAFYLPYLLT